MALLIDMTILLLLAGTLGYAFLVDRRVRALMAALRSLEPMVGEFSAAVDRTESSVKFLRGNGATRSAPKRGDEPRLTRTADRASAAAAQAPQGDSDADNTAASEREAAPAPSQLPPGVTRVTGKADLVRGFFETVRSGGA